MKQRRIIRRSEMAKKVLCAVDDSEHSKIAVAVTGAG
jgi:hypothetical protein